MDSNMYDEELKACCGARFLAFFGNCKDWEGTDIDRKWKGDKGRRALKRELEHKIKVWAAQKFLIAIINEEQWKNIGKIFIDLKFKLAACGNSGKESKPLYLLVYTKHEYGVKKTNGKKRIVKSSERSSGMAFF